MKKAAFYTVVALALVTIVFSVMVYIAPHLGWFVFSVTSGSMEPALKTGSLVVTGPVDTDTIEVGDIILFRPGYGTNNRIIHRVIEIHEDSELRFSTRGDANLNPDPVRIHVDNVDGRVLLNLAGFGGFIEFLRTTPGFCTMVVGPAAILLAAYVYNVWRALNSGHKAEA
jgi:signal peptidase